MARPRKDTAGGEETGGFDWFREKGRKLKAPYVTIMENGGILFNARFCRDAELVDKSHVALAYSKTEKAIAFDFTDDPETLGAAKITRRGRTASVMSRSFFNFNKLDVKEYAGRYTPEKRNLPKVGDAWIIKLDEKEQTGA